MIIGIGGISRSGKTSLAKAIQEQVNVSCCIVEQDDFVKQEEEIPTINGLTDWECPGSIDFEGFREQVIEQSRKYDLVLAAGLLVFYDNKLNSLFDSRIQLTIDKATFLKRKKEDSRWGFVPEWFVQHIWDSYHYYGELGTDKECLKKDARKEVDINSIIMNLNL